MKPSNRIKFKNGRPYVIYRCGKRGYENSYGEFKICPTCKERFFTSKHSNFCTISCSHKGKYNPMWKGGRTVDENGYISIKNYTHPFTPKNHLMLEHRLIMEKKLGRYLKPTERVHHKDGNPSNNDINNLHLFKNHSIHMKNCPRKNGKYAHESSPVFK